jgi:hypothetical protein
MKITFVFLLFRVVIILLKSLKGLKKTNKVLNEVNTAIDIKMNDNNFQEISITTSKYELYSHYFKLLIQ